MESGDEMLMEEKSTGEYSSEEDSAGEVSETSSSDSEAESGEEPSITDRTNEAVAYENVRLRLMDHPIVQEALHDDDHELWLMRMPRYEAFITGLSGREIEFIENADKSIQNGKITGRVKGYYVFRDYGPVDSNERAAFVTEDKFGKKKLQIAKPFARSVRITFDAPLVDQGGKEPPPRSYPVAPKGLTLKYRPIGSETAMAPKVSNESVFASSPLKKKRKLGVMNAAAETQSSTPPQQTASQRALPAPGNGHGTSVEVASRKSPGRKKSEVRGRVKVEPI